MSPADGANAPFVRRVATVAAVALLACLVLALVFYASDVLLLAFASIVFAVLIDGLSGRVSVHIGISRRWGLAIVIVTLLGGLAVAAAIIGPAVAQQVGEMRTALSSGLDSLQRYVEERSWAQSLLSVLPGDRAAAGLLDGSLGRITGTLLTIAGALSNLLIVAFVGLYLALHPQLYIDSAIRLVPKPRRTHIRETIARLGHALRRWLLGQFISMSVVGVLTTVGLFVLDVPLALTLGLIAFLTSFVPFLGPIVATVPAVLVAFMDGPRTALWVLGLYLGVQLVESNVLTPLVQKTVVSLPPAVLIMAQILVGALAGVLGIALATPMAITMIVLIQTFYVQDVLGDDIAVLGTEP